MWGMTNVNRLYPCLSYLKYNVVRKGPSAATWACDFIDCHIPIIFDLSTLSSSAVISSFQNCVLYVCCHVCLVVMILHSTHNRCRS